MQRTHRPDTEACADSRILGPVEVITGENRLAIEGRRTRILLAMLLVWRNQIVSLDALIDGLWPHGPPSSAKSTLHAHISRLRGALAAAGPLAGSERVGRKPPGYELRTLDGEVDADRFERMLAVAEAAMQERRFASASSTLRDALLLVHGPMLGECRDEPFAQAEVARLEAMQVRAQRGEPARRLLQVTHGRTCVDSRRQWRHAKNVWHNAMLRSMVQTLTAPFRRGRRRSHVDPALARGRPRATANRDWG